MRRRRSAMQRCMRSDPPDRAVVARAPSTLTLTFNEPVSPISLKLVGDGGHALDLALDCRAGRSADRHAAGAAAGGHAPVELARDVRGRPPGGWIADLFRGPAQRARADAWILRAAPPRSRCCGWRGLQSMLGLFAGVGGAVVCGVHCAGQSRDAGRAAAARDAGRRPDRGDCLGGPARRRRARRAALGNQTAVRLGKRRCQSIRGDGGARPQHRCSPPTSLFPQAPTGNGLSRCCRFSRLGAALAASGHASAAAPQWLTRPAVFVHGVSVACWAGALHSARQRAAKPPHARTGKIFTLDPAAVRGAGRQRRRAGCDSASAIHGALDHELWPHSVCEAGRGRRAHGARRGQPLVHAAGAARRRASDPHDHD